MPAAFELHPRLAADCAVVGDFPLCRLLLMDDAQYPWTILVPRRAGVREIYALAEDDQAQLLRESVMLSRALMAEFRGDKLNVAALGNLVAQLHLHHIVRYRSDPAWPAPVWGRHPPRRYAPAERAAQVRRIARVLPAPFCASTESSA